jgi:anti-sigma B factor antagonist
MEIQIKQESHETVLLLESESILGNEAVQIQNTVLDQIENGCKKIVIDLSKINYLTSWGAGILIYAHTTCQNRNVVFSLTGVNAMVMDIFKKVKLDKIFDIDEL